MPQCVHRARRKAAKHSSPVRAHDVCERVLQPCPQLNVHRDRCLGLALPKACILLVELLLQRPRRPRRRRGFARQDHALASRRGRIGARLRELCAGRRDLITHSIEGVAHLCHHVGRLLARHRRRNPRGPSLDVNVNTRAPRSHVAQPCSNLAPRARVASRLGEWNVARVPRVPHVACACPVTDCDVRVSACSRASHDVRALA